MGNNISFFNSKSKGLQEVDNKSAQTSTSEDDGLKFTHEQLNMFIKMFEEDRVLEDFLIFDRCCVLADKYLLAMCFVYFVRAGLKPTEYGRLNFYTALYLAHMMEEDDYELRSKLFPWASAPSIKLRRRPLLRSIERMWIAMDGRTVVSKFSCNQVIEVCPKAKIWLRDRPAHHGNAYRQFEKCSNCEPKGFNDILDFYEFDDDVYLNKPTKLKDASAALESYMESSSVEDSGSDESPNDSSDHSFVENSVSENSFVDNSPCRERVALGNKSTIAAFENPTSTGINVQVSANSPIDEPRQMEDDINFYIDNSINSGDVDYNNNNK